MRKAARDFKEFVLKGDVVALAVAVVVATAFGAVVTAFVSSIITPLIAAVGGKPDFAALAFTINGSRFAYGVFINAAISFLIIAAIVFFLVVRPYNRFKSRFLDRGDDTVPPPRYAVEQAAPEAMAAVLNARAAEGWRVVSIGDGRDGALRAVLVKGAG